MEPNARDIMEIHRQTGWPVLRCKAALVAARGDVDAAVQFLRDQYVTRVSPEQAEKNMAAFRS